MEIRSKANPRSLIAESSGWALIIDMEIIPCQAQPEHIAVWGCSCVQPALPFCAPCLLLHIQSPGRRFLSSLGPMGPRPSDHILAEVVQAAGSLQEVFIQRKNDVRQNITRAMESMNALEDTFYRALAQDAELRLCQTQLAHAQEELLRLRALPPPQVPIASANEALVQTLKSQLEQINARLLDQGALQTQIQELSTQVSQLKYELQKSVQDQVKQSTLDLREHLQAAARTAVNKVTDVMPLVTHLDGDWLDREGAESFLRLASLGINEDLQSACMRKVARVCSLFARASGPLSCPRSFRQSNQHPSQAKLRYGATVRQSTGRNLPYIQGSAHCQRHTPTSPTTS